MVTETVRVKSVFKYALENGLIQPRPLRLGVQTPSRRPPAVTGRRPAGRCWKQWRSEG